MAEEDEISDEAFGQLRLKRKAGGTGYMFVTGPKPKCKKNPYQARIMNNRIGKTQSLGSFPTAHAAAVAVASALANGDNEDMESPKKRRQRGTPPTRHRALHLLPCVHTPWHTRLRGCLIACQHHGTFCRTHSGQLIPSPCAAGLC